jgi:hypothetical protein
MKRRVGAGGLDFGWEADFLDGPVRGRRELPFPPSEVLCHHAEDGVRTYYRREKLAELAYRSFEVPPIGVG